MWPLDETPARRHRRGPRMRSPRKLRRAAADVTMTRARRPHARFKGRYQGALAPFWLRFDAVADRYWRCFQLPRRTWNEPRSWTAEQVEQLVRLGVWLPIASASPGEDRRPLIRSFEAWFAARGETLER